MREAKNKKKNKVTGDGELPEEGRDKKWRVSVIEYICTYKAVKE